MVGSHGGRLVCSREVAVVCGEQPVKIHERFGLHCGQLT